MTGREKRCKNSGWAGVLVLLSFLYRTWQYDNILSPILSDTRLWSSPIINPGWAPAQVVQQRRPTDCQHVWQTTSIPQTWRWSCTGDTLTLSAARTVGSAELQPTNPSVELITRSLLKTQARPCTLKLRFTDMSELPLYNTCYLFGHKGDCFLMFSFCIRILMLPLYGGHLHKSVKLFSLFRL